MSDLKTTSVLQKLYKNSTREGQVSLVSTHDVTNPPVHYCLDYNCFNVTWRYISSDQFQNIKQTQIFKLKYLDIPSCRQACRLVWVMSRVVSTVIVSGCLTSPKRAWNACWHEGMSIYLILSLNICVCFIFRNWSNEMYLHVTLKQL